MANRGTSAQRPGSNNNGRNREVDFEAAYGDSVDSLSQLSLFLSQCLSPSTHALFSGAKNPLVAIRSWQSGSGSGTAANSESESERQAGRQQLHLKSQIVSSSSSSYPHLSSTTFFPFSLPFVAHIQNGDASSCCPPRYGGSQLGRSRRHCCSCRLPLVFGPGCFPP